LLELESSAFVGRHRELAAISRAVIAGRLSTLAGEAGVGKTRLAHRFARGQRALYEAAGGVWFCDLRGARDAEGMSAALARAMSIADEAALFGDAAPVAVGRALAARGRALVVLDNLEHLLPGGAEVVLRWLDLAPEARLLVTSRQPLGVAGEHVIEVGPLPLPGEAGGACDAVDLFVERVRARDAGFAPTADEARSIADLVRRVRGVPLAIELCASRFSARERARGRPSPQGDEGARAIAWSFSRLGPRERETLVQCSVFRGGFTLDAAEHVVELPQGMEPRSVAEVVAGLHGKGLLQSMRAEGGERFTLCEGIRAHAAGLIEESVEASGAPWRHARYFLDWGSGSLTDLGPLSGPGAAQAQTRAELLPERDNVEAVLEFGAATGRPDLVLRAAVVLDFLSSGTGLSRAQLGLLDEALRTSQSLDPATVGRALGVRAGALRAMGRLVEAERDAATALGLARRAGAKREVVAMHLAVGGARFQMGDLDGALAHSQAALDASRGGDRREEPIILQQIGAVHQARGDAAAARAHYDAALSRAMESGDGVAEARASMGLGSYHLEMGDLVRAEVYYDRGLLLARRLGMTRSVRIVMGYLGVKELDAGRPQEAERWLDKAARLSRAAGDPRVEGVFEGIRGAALAALDLLDESRAAFTLAAELLRDNVYFYDVIELHRGHLDLAEARALRAEGHLPRADLLERAAERRIAIAEQWQGDTPPLVQRSDDARIARRILRRALLG
jgi:predicted ATPase